MFAANGSASRARMVVVCLAVTVALSAVFAPAAGAHVKPITQTYLALGDSLAFGYSQQLSNENQKAGEPPSAFDNGYVNGYYKQLKPKTGVGLQNLGCPNETSGGLIGEGAVGSYLEGMGATTGPSCAYHNVDHLALHNEYYEFASQLETALGLLAVDAFTGVPITHVSLNIGTNDELAQIHACETEVSEEFAHTGTSKYGATREVAVGVCLYVHANALASTISKNIEAILFALRNGAELGSINYTGSIVLLGGYDPYGNVSGTGEVVPDSLALVSDVNRVEGELAPRYGACFVNPLDEFNPQGKSEPGKLQTLTNMANHSEYEGKMNGPDINPTPKGYKILASSMNKTCGH